MNTNTIKTLAALLGMSLLISCGESSGGRSYSMEQFCKQSSEAAHYIAAKSMTQAEIVRNTNNVIADRKYPLLKDKELALIGSVVATSKGLYTPEETGQKIYQTCMNPK